MCFACNARCCIAYTMAMFYFQLQFTEKKQMLYQYRLTDVLFQEKDTVSKLSPDWLNCSTGIPVR